MAQATIDREIFSYSFSVCFDKDSENEIYGNTNSLEGTYKYFLTIKRALVRLDAIDNSNPSEALEDLDKMVGLEKVKKAVKKLYYKQKFRICLLFSILFYKQTFA